ncbi:MAG TPA: MlaE family lipid ABC transporter permease subunit [Stellaceae bacterium]|jgi:phospholipid/cholesterol/gamma-HCH transport system permease protein|nr:MlaE family lipid ABC transporter permease subunit [Stellaceae bacterium]
MAQSIEQTRDGDALVLRPHGRWVVADAQALDDRLAEVKAGAARRVRIDLAGVEAMDTTGAWLLFRLKRGLEAGGASVSVDHIGADLAPLFAQIEKRPSGPVKVPRRGFGPFVLLEHIGYRTVELLRSARALVGFFGEVAITFARIAARPQRLRFTPMVAQMQRAGVSALGIVGLLSFLVGIVMTYIGAQQLKPYGAEIFTVNLLAVGTLRELGGLMSAIIIAGRSGSAFTAEIGAMMVNEEVDAMRTLGLDPIEVLVVPRILGLILTLPLLTFWADFTGLAGGALMCRTSLDIPLTTFLVQLHSAVSLWSVFLGIIKAPFFAVCIALIGCNEGLLVSRSAESVGRHTTQSVVQAIFLVIVLDALFSILFNELGI